MGTQRYNHTRDLPWEDFDGDDQAAYEYALANNACVYDDTTMQCVYCHRGDH